MPEVYLLHIYKRHCCLINFIIFIYRRAINIRSKFAPGSGEKSMPWCGVELPLVVRNYRLRWRTRNVCRRNLQSSCCQDEGSNSLKNVYNQREAVNIDDYKPTVAASLLTLFLRLVNEFLISRIILFLYPYQYFDFSESYLNLYWKRVKPYRVLSKRLQRKKSLRENLKLLN